MKKTAFEKLFLKQQRVEIAKDVIANVKNKFFVAETGIYFNPILKRKYKYHYLFNPEEFGKVELSDAISDRVKKCEVCAIGGVFIAAINKFDKLKCPKNGIYTENQYMLSYLERWFSTKQMRLMEIAFEVAPSDGYYNNTNTINGRAIYFGNQYLDPD